MYTFWFCCHLFMLLFPVSSMTAILRPCRPRQLYAHYEIQVVRSGRSGARCQLHPLKLGCDNKHLVCRIRMGSIHSFLWDNIYIFTVMNSLTRLVLPVERRKKTYEAKVARKGRLSMEAHESLQQKQKA